MIALTCAAIILLLGILSVSPRLHARLHGLADSTQPEARSCCAPLPDAQEETETHDDTGCIVYVFHHGVEIIAGSVALIPPVTLDAQVADPASAVVLVTNAWRLHPPAHAPPAC
jgi:hypothetical protein